MVGVGHKCVSSAEAHLIVRGLAGLSCGDPRKEPQTQTYRHAQRFALKIEKKKKEREHTGAAAQVTWARDACTSVRRDLRRFESADTHGEWL